MRDGHDGRNAVARIVANLVAQIVAQIVASAAAAAFERPSQLLMPVQADLPSLRDGEVARRAIGAEDGDDRDEPE